jgi:hypothetical protein
MTNIMPTHVKIRIEPGIRELFLKYVVSNHFKFVIFVRQITWFRWNVQYWASGVNEHNKNSNRVCVVLTFDLQHKKILTFSVKNRYQLNYFICIKNFNAETMPSLKFNLFSFFICCCQHHEIKRSAFIYFWYQTDSGVPNTSPRFLCRPTAFVEKHGKQRICPPTLGQHISTFRGYLILFSIRNPYIHRFTNHFSIHS